MTLTSASPVTETFPDVCEALRGSGDKGSSAPANTIRITVFNLAFMTYLLLLIQGSVSLSGSTNGFLIASTAWPSA
jgi:hypothetical protein